MDLMAVPNLGFLSLCLVYVTTKISKTYQSYLQSFLYLCSNFKFFVLIYQVWRWIGHILRKPANNITRQALRWNPQGKRKRGRPRNSWRRGVESQMRNWGHTWATLGSFAQDRTRWRTEVVNGLCSNRS